MLPVLADRSGAAVWGMLYRGQLTERPKRFPSEEESGRSKTLGWVFVSQDCRSMKACRTYQTLFALSESHTYYTPNTFYRNDQREEAALRWLNAIVVDVDVKDQKNAQNHGLSPDELLERIAAAGLPCPSLIVQTPSRGYHVYFVLDTPRKAYSNAIQTYKKLQLSIASAIGGDRQAIGAERWFRLPTPETIVFQSNQRTNFAELIDWLDINDTEAPKGAEKALQGKQGLLERGAVQTLLEGTEKGKRDNACYTLALAFKAEGCDEAEAEDRLQEWNSRLADPLPIRIVSQKVRSAYKPGAPAGPSAEWVRYLSGQAFSYRVWESAKPRSERKTSHYHEWAADVIETLAAQPNGELAGSQRELAGVWGMSLSTFQHVIKLLLELGKITVTVEGKGRAAKTILRLVKDAKVALLRPSHNRKKNVPDSNTFTLVGVVGGVPAAGRRGFLRRFGGRPDG